jgi:hypothetical protein
MRGRDGRATDPHVRQDGPCPAGRQEDTELVSTSGLNQLSIVRKYPLDPSANPAIHPEM